MSERQVELTRREWTLVRVALLRRLDDLSRRIVEERANNGPFLEPLTASYDESKALLNGKLSIWKED